MIGTVTAKQWGEGSREFIQKRRKWSEISKGNKQKYEKGKIIFIFWNDISYKILPEMVTLKHKPTSENGMIVF